MAVKIGHASIGERGKAKGGKAGDQTGKEVCIRDWYNGNWHTVFRPKDSKKAEKIAKACEQGCKNNHIGYDQNQRTTLYDAAKAVDWDLSKIKKNVETDCSAFVAVCCNAAGIKVTKNNWTGEEKAILTKTGAFDVLTDKKYTGQSAYLKRGDILLKDGHTAMVLSNGSKVVTKSKTSTEKSDTYKPWKGIVATNKSKLNVRSSASMGENIVGTLDRGSTIEIVGEKGNWYIINYKNSKCYVAKKWIKRK